MDVPLLKVIPPRDGFAYSTIIGETSVNTNLIHNILNFLIAITAGLAGFDFSSIVSATTAGKIVAILAAAKLVMNALRDGLSGMVKPQPPVQ